MIKRRLEQLITPRLFKGKAIVLTGPRQVGKTTLLRMMMAETDKKTLFWNCDEPDIRQKLSNPTSTQLQADTAQADLVLIDEAQRVQNIGITLKLLIDNFPEKQIIVTGSSALQLSNSINEPLTGRKYEYNMLPFSSEELIDDHSDTEEKRLLERRMVYGMYPEVVNLPGDERETLSNLVNSYLYKDVFAFQDVRKPEIIEQLLQALALQMGSEVSFNELSKLLGLNSQTVQRYIDLLEKSYILFHLRSFSRNLRNELKKSRKIYFYDNGVRNAILGDFKPLQLRQDAGALWENFLVSERLKHNSYSLFYGKNYFWRTQQQQEVDYIEDIDGVLHTYEFKWSKAKQPKLTETFAHNYPEHTFTVVNPDNYQDFVTGRI
ncbi:MAG: ATP-binding protein [Bacteroidales bacterium]|jgi:predicted AAA+ superfamily ATPase|nr:ATP-binding protein [Bacteroidales bacterium]MBR6930400.1 ATP-binding protein [Bacteroidales bacterium]